MSVLRRDPTTGRWVVFSDNASPVPAQPGPCAFCAGNEALTPPEIVAWGPADRRPNAPGWSVRVVPNARPLLTIEGQLERRAEGMYDSGSGTGAHEIVVESPEHEHSLAELSAEQIARVLRAYAQRIADLKRDTRMRSIFVFKNQGVLAGAGRPGHTHSHVIGLPVTPKALKEILEGARAHYQVKERCVFCDLLIEELEAESRVIQVTDRFVSLAPYASRHPFECWIVPREHSPDFETLGDAEIADLAPVLGSLLGRLERVLPEPSYNLFLYSSPNHAARPKRWPTLKNDFHWHIQILPRLVQVAGFEVGSGFYANAVTPEQAAAVLRDVR
jgi:UDPglucose--hexose-1-phosphate uridylyltransferase